MRPYYKTYYMIAERPYDVFKKLVDKRIDSAFLFLSHNKFFPSAQMWNIHRNIGHFRVGKQSKNIETAEQGDILVSAWSVLLKNDEYLYARQRKRETPSRFMFSIRDAIILNCNPIWPPKLVRLMHRSMLSFMETRKEFQGGISFTDRTKSQNCKDYGVFGSLSMLLIQNISELF